MTLKPLDKHCHDLSQIIYRGDIDSDYDKAAEWLHIASGIKAVAFDGTKFDDDIGYCGSADEYLSAESELAQAFVQKLTVFNYTWLAIESLESSANRLNQGSFFGKLGRESRVSPAEGGRRWPEPTLKICGIA